jgi:uncharacterized protein YndB with AHSA1/START domain
MSQVGAMEVTTPTDREILIRRTFNAPRALVFDAFNNCQYLKQWMLGPEGWTMSICEIDLRPGGKYRLVWRRPERPDMEIHGVYKEVAPPERVVATENWGGDWPEGLNTYTFIEENGKTTVKLTILYPSKDARDRAIKTGMNEGMAVSFDRLEEYLGTLK